MGAPETDPALVELLQSKLIRERAARRQAETLLEDKSLELYHANQVMQRANVELIAARDSALDAARSKAEFLANMSHEIRTPMNGVLGFVDLLTGTNLDAEQREFVETIRTAGEALLALINDILDFSKVEAGKIELDSVDFDLRQLVEGVGDILAPRAAAKNLELTCAVWGEEPAWVRGDPARLRQVLVNLLGNAVKFTDRGEVDLRADVTADADGRMHVVFCVRDTGIGIPSDKRHRLFQPFSQVDGSTTRRFEGTGLGLVISRRLLTLMGGTIEVESEPGVGTTFIVLVTLDRGEKPADVATLRFDGLRVLAVDDNPTNRALLEETLRPLGCVVHSVSSAAEALASLEAARSAGAPHALALLDLQMPNVDGISLARAIRARSAHAGTILILLSSMSVPRTGDHDESLFAAVLTKPVKQARLLRVIADAVRGGGAQSPPGPGAMIEAKDVLAAPEDALAASHAALTVPQGVTKPPHAALTVPQAATTGATGATDARSPQKDALVPPARVTGSDDGRPMRILLAEDTPTNQRLVVILLQRMGHSALVVANGREAVEAILREHFDLVLMDAQMPELDGYEATAAIRTRERATGAAHVVIIAMTAHVMTGDRERCLAAGMDDYLAKPVQIGELQKMIDKWASWARTRSAGAGAGVSLRESAPE